MRVFSAPTTLFNQVSDLRSSKKTIGLVPTMGALHEGHLSLIKKAKEDNDIVIVSIFVNPLQFNNSSDLSKYPRTLDSDTELLKSMEVDILFVPTEEEMYPTNPSISIDFGQMSTVLEGKYRKGHFEGVGVVVTKLLHSANPDRAYFGLKDLQQFLLIKKMCEDLNFPVKIIGVETLRNQDGLALSSRNARLSEKGLIVAAHIFSGLKKAQEQIFLKNLTEEIKKDILAFYETIAGLEIEYFDIVNTQNFESIKSYNQLDELAICVAGYVDGIRLIDNLYLRLK